MKSWRRILSVMELSARGLATARQAFALALAHEAQFALGHIVDWDHGAGEFSMLTPTEIEDRLENIVKRKLMEMSSLIGACNAQALVSFKPGRQGLAEIAQGWQPDLLILDAKSSFGLGNTPSAAKLGWNCEIQTIDIPVPSFHLAGLFHTLAQPLLNRRAASS